MKKRISLLLAAIIYTMLFSFSSVAQDDAAELAKKLSNPIASLISVPFQNNTDVGIGTLNGARNTLNIQPVVPISVSENINLIGRVILPVVSQYNITGAGENQSGLGDAVLSAFFSPKVSKVTWGAGPVFLLPIGSEHFSAKKLGIGPTAVALYQTNGMTIGALVNQIWSVAGDKDYSDISSLFFQPFFAYNWKSGAGIGGNFELTQNWKAETTVLWFNPTVSAVTAMGKQKVQFVIGPRLNLSAPESAKSKFGVRAVLVFLFPK
ncbi:hypothetical protein [Maribellus sediminis]|uniref:hypothetical protein n=1 Tax=Maribellus sediminis TaxID=2696285 RepID=UPI00142F8672|nr:hypothetical protein [Maribellus sediminis]